MKFGFGLHLLAHCMPLWISKPWINYCLPGLSVSPKIHVQFAWKAVGWDCKELGAKLPFLLLCDWSFVCWRNKVSERVSSPKPINCHFPRTFSFNKNPCPVWMNSSCREWETKLPFSSLWLQLFWRKNNILKVSHPLLHAIAKTPKCSSPWLSLSQTIHVQYA